ncbi:hypothetical protein N658DRAFT_415690 [Parathielavia hyrcaniae]|uniref:Serine hydrolase domain-containing protein n=1 Tax=Parathielavia hyrcaniae TaxID=113614 RepID=A0AAN6QAR4_9PEZI|nr:hypothetical protein N658DRAFT_415690 [Parathielavia hyrcaniae]
MRFLCLHGRGTNSNILEAQLAPLISRLSAQHEFDFVDGELDCRAAPGMSKLYPPPYLCWYERGHPQEIQAAQDYLRSIIDQDGPYDGVIAFSEGAALATSLLLSDEAAGEPRFTLAIFFNSVVPLVPSGSEHLGGSLREIVYGHQDSYLDLLLPEEQKGSATEPEKKAALSQALCFSPKLSNRISIPTVHVIGRRDAFAESSRVVVDLCARDMAQEVFHQGGHELPRDGSVLDECAEMIETAILFAS